MDFNILSPMQVTEAELVSSNVPEDDHPQWQAETVYAAGARVISTQTHRIYESLIDDNSGRDPRIDDGSAWLELSVTNRWRAFDQNRSNPARQANEITYSIVPSQDCDAIALFGLTAGSLRIEVWDGALRIYDQRFEMADTGHVVSAYTWFFGGVVYARQKVVNGFPGYLGHRIDITIDANGAMAEVGHIVLGRNNLLGRVLNLPSVRFVSHSRKGYDDFGNEILVKRGSTRKVDLSLLVPTHQAQRVMDIVAEVDGLATAFYLSGDGPGYGIEGLGFVDDHSQPIDVAGESVFPLILKTLKQENAPMSIPSFSAFPEIPQRSTPEADFDAKMYALFQHFASTHRQELLAFIQFLENNVTAIEGAINGVTIGLTHPAAAKFTSLAADSISGAAVQATPDDTTAGRLMKVGAFGLGGNALIPPNNDLNDIGATTGLWRGGEAGIANSPPAGPVIVQHLVRAVDAYVQIATTRGNEPKQIFARHKTQTTGWSDWSKVIIVDSNGITPDNIEIRNSGPFFAITDADTGVKHILSGNSTAGHFYLKTDSAENMPNSALLIETQGVRQAAIAKDDVEFYVPIEGDLNVKGTLSSGFQATGNAALKVGQGRTTDNPSFIDLIGDTVHSTYGARMIRTGGENGGTAIEHRGTGNLSLLAYEAADIHLRTDVSGLNRGVVLSPIGIFRPASDNVQSCGIGSHRWSQIFAASGTINTSDARTKTDIQDLDAAERRVAVVAKNLLKKYRIRDAVAEKGDAARWHFGVIAQELAAAFEAEGLDPWRYGVLCWDEWWSAMVEIPAETAPIMEEVEEEITHTVTVEEPVLDEHGEPTGEVQQVEKEMVVLVKKQVETGELEILTEARTELQTFASAEDAPEGSEYHDRQGVRYDELFAFILAAL